MPPSLIFDSLIRSIQVGSLYALMALGLTLTFAVMRFPNFAYAEYITVGAYTALLVSMRLANLPIILIASFAVAALVAWLTHRAVFRPLAQLKLSMYTLILASFAVGLILRYLIFLFVDANGLFDKRIQIPLQVFLRTPVMVITNIFVWSVPTVLLLVILLSLVLNRTSLGRQMRALADNEILARVMGIRVARVHDLTWLIVGGLAGVGGAFWGMYTSLNPLMGWITILSVFAASILGGMTSFSGTIIGAYIVALSENFVMQWLNFQFGLDFTFKAAVPFVIIILVLLLRPQGLTQFLNRT
ncbi:MAG TPA: branched-chain amino acid ABC transporter permease [Anaerolineae bacterium]|nr:branched-chain amino acid ABC transporter permease [Anaerolineae bacterium]